MRARTLTRSYSNTGTTINSLTSCNVICDESAGFVPTVHEYTCGASSNSLTTNVTSCTRKACEPVNISSSVGIETAVTSNGCEPEQRLFTNESCNLQCATGYQQISGSGTYSCPLTAGLPVRDIECERITCTALPNTFPVGTEPQHTNSNPCSVSQVLNSLTHCDIQCSHGYVSAMGRYECDADGVLTNTLGVCNEIVCSVPSNLGVGVIGTTDPTTSCSNISTVNALSSPDTCSVQCDTASGYEDIGIGTFSCDADTQTLITSFSCDLAQCLGLPSSLPQGMILDTCVSNQILSHGETCGVMCNVSDGYQSGSGV